jgi:hypothetical protein
LAFVELEIWDAKRDFRAGCEGEAVRPAPLPRLSKRQDRTLRYASAGLISACVHVLLLWVLATRLAPGLGPEAAAERAIRPVTLLDLAEPPSPPAEASGTAEGAAAPAPQPEPRPAEVDRTVANEVPPPEWTLAALRGGASGPSAPAPKASGAGAGEAAFDPYAGAAPARRAEAGAGAGLELDAAALEKIRIAVARSLTGGHGSAELAVRVAQDGRVLEAIALGGTASAAAKAALRRALIGAQLYRPRGGAAGSAPHMLRLPMLQLRT